MVYASQDMKPCSRSWKLFLSVHLVLGSLKKDAMLKWGYDLEHVKTT